MKEQSENNDLSKKFENFVFPVSDSNWDAISSRIPSGNGDGFLSEKFSAHAVMPSRQVWRGIDATMRPAARRRIAAWWWYGAAAAIFVMGYFAFQAFQTPDIWDEIAHTNIEKITDPETHPEIAKPDQTSGESKSKSFQSAPEVNSANSVATTSGNPAINHKSDLTFENTDSEKKITPDNTADVTDLRVPKLAFTGKRFVGEDSSKSPLEVIKLRPEKIIGIDAEIYRPIHTATLAGNKVTIDPIDIADNKKTKSSIFYDGTEMASQNKFAILAGSQLAFAGSGEENMLEANSPGIANGLNPIEELSFNDASIPVTFTYSTPTYYGVNGEIKFWRRLSAGLGLGYLRMKTTADMHNQYQSKAKENEAKYLSLPVYLKFNFVDKPKFAAYATAGHAIDLLIWQETIETSTMGQHSESHSVSNEPRGNQANLYAGLGMSLKFTNHLGVFAEGSLMRYYSLSHSNFFSRQNLWPGLRFGAFVSF